jgi:hypothetical protein
LLALFNMPLLLDMTFPMLFNKFFSTCMILVSLTFLLLNVFFAI